MSNWQPIDSAPKDGTKFLAFRNGQIEFSRWDEDKYSKKPKPYWVTGSVWGARYNRENPPTHWQPLPEPPKL